MAWRAVLISGVALVARAAADGHGDEEACGATSWVKASKGGETCEAACAKVGAFCEAEAFASAAAEAGATLFAEAGVDCAETEAKESDFAPYYNFDNGV